MRRKLATACWLPPALRAQIEALGESSKLVKRYWRNEDCIDVSFERLEVETLRRVASFLRERQKEVLRSMTVESIARILDLAADRWLDSAFHFRRDAVEKISVITGMSPEMVGHSIDLEQKSSRYPHLIAAVANELGNPSFLDDFVPSPQLGGFSFAQGPGLIGFICSSNIPALPHLEVMRAFLLKAACLARVSSREPIFLASYARSLAELDASLASCLAVVYWEHDDQQLEHAFLDSVEHLVVYGSQAQVRRLQSTKPPGLESTWHGHRIGFTYICREALTKRTLPELANRVSYDFTVFDGYACLVPQICLVERGGEVTPLDFARATANAMSEWALKLPPRRLSLAEASAKYRFRELCLMREPNDKKFHVVAAPNDHSFIVVLEELERFEPSTAERFVRIVPVEGIESAERLLRPLGPFLQCAAISVGSGSPARISALHRALASWGVTRIVPPGLMGTPSMMWHHDGMACLGKMIKWCDYEQMNPEELKLAKANNSLEYH